MKKKPQKNASTCDGHRKYFQQPTQVLSLALESTCVFLEVFSNSKSNAFSEIKDG